MTIDMTPVHTNVVKQDKPTAVITLSYRRSMSPLAFLPAGLPAGLPKRPPQKAPPKGSPRGPLGAKKKG